MLRDRRSHRYALRACQEQRFAAVRAASAVLLVQPCHRERGPGEGSGRGGWDRGPTPPLPGRDFRTHGALGAGRAGWDCNAFHRHLLKNGRKDRKTATDNPGDFWGIQPLCTYITLIKNIKPNLKTVCPES